MANLRHTKFYRNTGSATFATYDALFDLNNGLIASMENAKDSLHDGEIMLGRYTVKDKSGVIVGVARVSNNTVSLDYIFDNNLNNNIFENIVDNVLGDIASSNNLVSKTTENNMTKYSFGTIITQNYGINTVSGHEDFYFKSNPTNSNYIVTADDISGIVGAMYYKGTVSYTAPSLVPSPSASSVTTGDVYVASANFTLETPTTLISGTVPAGSYEAGDMFIYNGSSWNAVSGENQVEDGATLVYAGDGSQDFTTIGTVDGTAIHLKVVDNYARLLGTADADDVQNPTTATGRINVLNRVEETYGVITAATAYTLATVASTGAATDTSITAINGLVSTNVQGALAELASNASSDNTTINSLHGNFIIGSSMLAVDNEHRVIDVKTNSPYIGTNEDGSLTINHVDTNGDSIIGTDIATVKTVQNYINTGIDALDGIVDALVISTSLAPTGTVDVLTAVEERNGKIIVGTKVTLATVAHSGDAADVAVSGVTESVMPGSVNDALYTLHSRVQGLEASSVNGGDGISVNTQTANSVTVSTVNVDLAANAHAIGTTSYNTDSPNLLLIGSDGKLTIEDTWDCGTY